MGDLAANMAEPPSGVNVHSTKHGGMRPRRTAVKERHIMDASAPADALTTVGREVARLLRWVDLRESWWSRFRVSELFEMSADNKFEIAEWQQ